MQRQGYLCFYYRWQDAGHHPSGGVAGAAVRYMYMASVPQNMQRYCPGCKPIRDKEMLALYIWNRQRPKTVFRKSNGKKDRLKKSTQYTKQWKIENTEHLKEYQFGWKAKNKDSEKAKRILRNSKKTPEQRAEDNRKDREYRPEKKKAYQSPREHTGGAGMTFYCKGECHTVRSYGYTSNICKCVSYCASY